MLWGSIIIGFVKGSFKGAMGFGGFVSSASSGQGESGA